MKARANILCRIWYRNDSRRPSRSSSYSHVIIVLYLNMDPSFSLQTSSFTRKMMMASEPANGNSLPSVILGSSSTVGTSSASKSTSSLTLREQQHHQNVEGVKERKERQMRRLAAEMDDQRSKWVAVVTWLNRFFFVTVHSFQRSDDCKSQYKKRKKMIIIFETVPHR